MRCMLAWAVPVAEALRATGMTAMPQENHRLAHKRLLRATLGAALGACIVIGGAGAVYAGDDDDNTLPDVKFVQKFLRALGLRNGQEEAISAQERPPLVVPPNTTLPPPQATETLVQRDPAWPVDPDEKTRKQLKGRTSSTPAWVQFEKAQDELRPSASAAPKGTPVSTAEVTPQPMRDPMLQGQPLSPDQLGTKNQTGFWANLMGIKKTITHEEELAQFRGEPQRRSLTDPPPGYLTPSPSEPYGMNITKQRIEVNRNKDRQLEGVVKE
jgi:hypothetical protein